MNFHARIFSTITVLLVTTVLLAAGISRQKGYKNLQVLPKDISAQKLDSIMLSYNKALNVNCSFCHVNEKPLFPITPVADTVDYAIDGIMKENARKMIRLMIDINKNYFYFNKETRPEYLNTVSCQTCHRGNPFPLGE